MDMLTCQRRAREKWYGKTAVDSQPRWSAISRGNELTAQVCRAVMLHTICERCSLYVSQTLYGCCGTRSLWAHQQLPPNFGRLPMVLMVWTDHISATRYTSAAVVTSPPGTDSL